MSNPIPLNKEATAILDSSGNGTASVGPGSSAGPATWTVSGVIVTTNRPGQGPVPRCAIYLDQALQGVTYDGSFSQGMCTDLIVNKGSELTAIWSGGQVGDNATLTITGSQQ